MSLFEKAKQYFHLKDSRLIGEFNFNNKLAVLLGKDSRPGYAVLYIYKIDDGWWDNDEMDRCIDYIFNQLQITTLVCFVRKYSNADRLCQKNHAQLIQEYQGHNLYHLTKDCIESIRGNYKIVNLA